MVMGKVFERFPRLRFGVIEVGASWVGPMCERMDLHSKLMAKVGITYSMPPSEFIRRIVRVTPFWHEDVNLMVERYGLKEVYVFSTDYPHVEGSRDPIGRFRKTINRLARTMRRRSSAIMAACCFRGCSGWRCPPLSENRHFLRPAAREPYRLGQRFRRVVP